MKKFLSLVFLVIPALLLGDDSCWLNTYRFTDIEIKPQYDSVLGFATEDFICLHSSDTLRLDCVSPVADSVKIGNVLRYFYQTDSLLIVSLDKMYAVSETLSVDIFYRAVPVQVPTPFASGGIFIDQSLIYSCHAPFGLKTWIPCLDAHRHKALARQYYTVPDNLYVMSNGLLDSVIQLSGNRRKFFWSEPIKIAPYLQGLAAYDYSLTSSSTGGIPVILAAYPQDSAALAYDLRRLDTMLHVFEERYGDYPLEKIAYAEAPVPGGMENQDCILVGPSVITGTGSYEHLFAHELSHMWWGDFVTTENLKEVWFNEGMATFSEGIFEEKVSGLQAMHNYMHQKRSSYIAWEGSYGMYPMYDPPWQYYYSDLTYERPASVFYALRFMIGDSLFFSSLQNIVLTHGQGNLTWQDVDSVFSAVSGEDLSWFFQQWVLGSGTPLMRWIDFKKTAGADSALVRAWTLSNSTTDFTIRAPLFFFNGNDTFIMRATATDDTFDNYYSLTTDSVHLDPFRTQFTSLTEKEQPQITALLALDGSVLVSWSESQMQDLTGYNVYAALYGSTLFSKLNSTLITDTFFLAQNLTNGQKYTFYVTFEISDNWESSRSDTSSTTPVAFPFDRRILLVDETEGGNGSQPFLPTDAWVDSVYESLMTGITHDVFHCDTALPELSLLGHYQCVIWHSDEYFTMSQVKDNSQLVGSYIAAGGKFILSGWRAFEEADQDFLSIFNVEQAILVTQNNFEYSQGKNGFPDIYVNSSLMNPSWGGKMNRAMYFSASDIDTLGVWGGSYPQSGKITALGRDDSQKFVVTGFPLLFMQNSRGFLEQCFVYLDQVSVEESPVNLHSRPAMRLCHEGVEIFWGKDFEERNFSLKVFDITGRLVFDRLLDCSDKTLYRWEDNSGYQLPQGSYFLQIRAGEVEAFGKYFLMK
ncbi:hypothetical protein JXA84_06700 [candidate division WOR-3 bacterium]|nr:hypothetical protein [candidate division WOR-3 bacterium]